METILVIEDDAPNLRLVCSVLSSKGYDVRAALDAAAALVVVGEVLPALILMDLQLPGMGGLELTRRLRTDPRTRSIPIVALTANAMEGDEERARVAGCDGYITKPYDTRALPGLVAKYIAAACR